MSKPSEHKTVQARILAYAEAIGWTVVPREEAEKRRAGYPTRRDSGNGGQECPPSVRASAPLSLFFDDLLDAKVREFNPRYAEAIGWTIVSREEAEQRMAGFPTRWSSGGHGGQECPPSGYGGQEH